MKNKVIILTGVATVFLMGMVGCNTTDKKASEESSAILGTSYSKGESNHISSSKTIKKSEKDKENSISIKDKKGIKFGETVNLEIYQNVKNPFGSINGVELSVLGNDFSKTFGADGFMMSKSDDSAGVDCQNKKYKDLLLIVYGKTSNHISSKDIKKDGFYGYYVESQSNEKPNMEWGGLTWGASTDDIRKVYGKPTTENDDEVYTELVYDLGPGMELSFNVYKKEYKLNRVSGLQAVRLYVFDDEGIAEDFVNEVLNEDNFSVPDQTLTKEKK